MMMSFWSLLAMGCVILCTKFESFSTDLSIFMQLWDVAEDQKVVDIVRPIQNPQEAAETLLKFALDNFTSDNVTVLVVRFKNK